MIKKFVLAVDKLQINYKWKNLILFSFFTIFFWLFFTLGGVNIFDKGIFDTKHNLVWVYFVFVLFFFFTSVSIFILLKRNFSTLFLKATMILFLTSLLLSIISIPVYLITYNIRSEENFNTDRILFFSAQVLIFLILFIYLIKKFTYFVFSMTLKDDLRDEFINEYAWMFIFRGIKIQKKEDLLILKRRKNLFILQFFLDKKDLILIKFEGEEKIVEEKKIEINNHDFFNSVEEKNESEENDEEPKEIIKKIEANDFANMILKKYETHKKENQSLFILDVFEQFSSINVQGDVPEWYYWNNGAMTIKYIKKLTKVNK